MHCLLLQMVVRAQYQNLICRQRDKDTTPSTYVGWKVESGHLVAKLSMLPPVPKACKYIAQYSYSKGCTTLAKGEPDLHGNPTSTGACNCSDGETVSTNRAA